MDELKNRLSAEVQRSLLLGDEDKEGLLSSINAMPALMLEYLLNKISEKNRLVDQYVNRALRDDPAIVPELKEKIRSIKKNILNLEETESEKAENPEAILDETLKNI